MLERHCKVSALHHAPGAAGAIVLDVFPSVSESEPPSYCPRVETESVRLSVIPAPHTEYNYKPPIRERLILIEPVLLFIDGCAIIEFRALCESGERTVHLLQLPSLPDLRTELELDGVLPFTLHQ